MNIVEFKLEGMTCGGCVRSVERVLAGLPGIQESKVEVGSAKVTFDPTVLSAELLQTALSKTGFRVEEL